MKMPYEKPIVTKLQTGWMNKYGRTFAYARKVRTEIDGVGIDDLVGQFGSPLFVYSERTLRRLYRQMHSAFSTRYPNVVFGWSYKTNYLGAICALMHQLGSWAEVVSAMEYQKARALGVPGEKIVFNGPHKPRAALERAVAEGATINVDHLDEIYDLEKVSLQLGRPIHIGLRLNLDAGIYPQWSRFGFNLESGQALEAAKRIKNGGKLRVHGLHCHLGTYLMETAPYQRQVEKLVGFATDLERTFGFALEYLDLGGGFPSKSRLKGVYLPPEVALPSMDEYAETIAQALSKTLPPGEFPRLILEAGRALVDEAGYLIATVGAAKRLADGTRAYVVDAGVNLLFTSYWYKFNIELDREVGGMNEHSVVYGPLCMNIDALDEGVALPPLARGTRLILSPVGAYNQTQSMQFIEYRPAAVLVGERGQVDVIREAEDLSDITRRERVPTRFASPPQTGP
ncbi:MAG: diaminopimelate decarboxylase [Verrucomicrobia bacterium]|nr:diaminopimelate decarboxylase [Verrucomicrobiota bacterium]